MAFDRKLVSRFQLVQQGEVPTVYAVFDCLYRNGRDLRQQLLPARRAAVEESIGDIDRLFVSRRLPGNGIKAYAMAKKKGWEGLVAKEEASPYVEGRSTKWLKVKAKQEEEFVIAGYTPPGGSPIPFRFAPARGLQRPEALLRRQSRHRLQPEIAGVSLYKAFQPLVQKTPGFVNPPREKGAVWLRPKLVAQTAFQEWTDDGKLRQPVFLGLRDDKKPSEVLLPWEPS